MMKRRLLAPMLLGLAVAASLLAQEPPKAPAAPPAAQAPAAPAAADTPTFPTQLEQVIVDLVVTDKKGVPIKGLTAADMTVTEDGVKQDVVSFEAVELPEQPSAAAPAAAQGLLERHSRGAARAHVRRGLRRHAHHALARQPGEGRRGELPREGHPRRRPRVAHLHGRRDLVDLAHGGGPPEADRHGEDLRRAPDPRHEPRAHVGLRGAADPRLPRPAGGRARAAALRDVRRHAVDAEQQARTRCGPAPPTTPTSPAARPTCTSRPTPACARRST